MSFPGRPPKRSRLFFWWTTRYTRFAESSSLHIYIYTYISRRVKTYPSSGSRVRTLNRRVAIFRRSKTEHFFYFPQSPTRPEDLSPYFDHSKRYRNVFRRYLDLYLRRFHYNCILFMTKFRTLSSTIFKLSGECLSCHACLLFLHSFFFVTRIMTYILFQRFYLYLRFRLSVFFVFS